ncbi:MAG: dockerin type I repeat-containing protein [Clostridia bacterium]|nr:dockerin type I repeat-containing protein [Clostridia bacterium]
MWKRILSVILITALATAACVTVCADGGTRTVDFTPLERESLQDYIWNYAPTYSNKDSVYLCNTRTELLEALKHIHLPSYYADTYDDSYFETKSLLLFKGHGSHTGCSWSVADMTVADRTLNLSLQMDDAGAGGDLVFYRIYQVQINEKITDIDAIHVETTYNYSYKDPAVIRYDLAYPQSPFLAYGDADGNQSVEAEDALLILQTVVGKATLSEAQATAAEVDDDHEITAKDALMVLQKIVGKIEWFPVGIIQISQNRQGVLGTLQQKQSEPVANVALLTNPEELAEYLTAHGLNETSEQVEEAKTAFPIQCDLLVYSVNLPKAQYDRMTFSGTVYTLRGPVEKLYAKVAFNLYHYVRPEQNDAVMEGTYFVYQWITRNRNDTQTLYMDIINTTVNVDAIGGSRLDEASIYERVQIPLP